VNIEIAMSAQRFDNQFNRADENHDGTIDPSEFRHFLGPIQNERRLSGNISAEDIKNFVRKTSNFFCYLNCFL